MCHLSLETFNLLWEDRTNKEEEVLETVLEETSDMCYFLIKTIF